MTASANGEQVIAAGGFADLIDARVDGVVAARDGLRGKPAPDTFLAGARALGVRAAQAVVFEDALSGVAAGRAGNFGFVVGVDRVGQADGAARARRRRRRQRPRRAAGRRRRDRGARRTSRSSRGR